MADLIQQEKLFVQDDVTTRLSKIAAYNQQIPPE
jgi:hypothetical protein